MKKITITQRKIGPGLKAFLKFKNFTGELKLDMGGTTNMDKLASLPLDVELLDIILKGSGHVRDNTRDYMLNCWIPKELPKISNDDAIKTFVAIGNAAYFSATEPYGKVIVSRLRDIVKFKHKSPFIHDPTNNSTYLMYLTNESKEFNQMQLLEYVIENCIGLDHQALSACVSNTIEAWPEYTSIDNASSRIRKLDAYVEHAMTLASNVSIELSPYLLGPLLDNYQPYLIAKPVGNGVCIEYNPPTIKRRKAKTAPEPQAIQAAQVVNTVATQPTMTATGIEPNRYI